VSAYFRIDSPRTCARFGLTPLPFFCSLCTSDYFDLLGSTTLPDLCYCAQLTLFIPRFTAGHPTPSNPTGFATFPTHHPIRDPRPTKSIQHSPQPLQTVTLSPDYTHSLPHRAQPQLHSTNHHLHHHHSHHLSHTPHSSQHTPIPFCFRSWPSMDYTTFPLPTGPNNIIPTYILDLIHPPTPTPSHHFPH